MNTSNKKKDRRYEIISSLVRDGKVVHLSDIVKFVPKTTLSKDLSTKVVRMNALLKRPEKFKVEEILLIADLCGLPEKKIFDLVIEEIRYNKRYRRSIFNYN